MDTSLFVETLKREVCIAQGCTEPIAVSFATSLACEDLEGEKIEQLDLFLSTNIIKNAMGVGIPGTGETGLEIAIALGAIIQKSCQGLEILCGFTDEQLELARQFKALNIINMKHKATSEPLYIEVYAKSEHHCGHVVVAREHTHVILHEKDGEIILQEELSNIDTKQVNDDDGMSVSSIIEFCLNVDVNEITFLLEGAKMNKAVSDEGLKHAYGLQVGSKIRDGSNQHMLNNSLASRIISVTAAASDARMDGCAMPIMTTAGSGNQGITCSLPVYELALILEKDEEQLLRALALSQLMTIHMKFYMGRLSPLCGAGIAGTTGACCGMTYLLGGSEKQIGYAINNMLSDVAGMICDGAKSTCALKIATNVHAAIQCANLALSNISPNQTQGIIFDEAEQTIRHLRSLVKVGLAKADECILDIMLQKC